VRANCLACVTPLRRPGTLTCAAYWAPSVDTAALVARGRAGHGVPLLTRRFCLARAGALRQQVLAPYGAMRQQSTLPVASLSSALGGAQGGAAPLVQARSLSPPRSRSLEMRSV